MAFFERNISHENRFRATFYYVNKDVVICHIVYLFFASSAVLIFFCILIGFAFRFRQWDKLFYLTSEAKYFARKNINFFCACSVIFCVKYSPFRLKNKPWNQRLTEKIKTINTSWKLLGISWNLTFLIRGNLCCIFYRSAYKWWSMALDNILLVKDWQSNWKKFIDVNDRTVMSVKRLLDRCGLKGCLLGGVIATSIAK